MTDKFSPPTEGELREPMIWVNLVPRADERGIFRDAVSFTLEGESEPFGEVPYEMHRRYGPEMGGLVRAAVNAGRLWGRTEIIQAPGREWGSYGGANDLRRGGEFGDLPHEG